MCYRKYSPTFQSLYTCTISCHLIDLLVFGENVRSECWCSSQHSQCSQWFQTVLKLSDFNPPGPDVGCDHCCRPCNRSHAIFNFPRIAPLPPSFQDCLDLLPDICPSCWGCQQILFRFAPAKLSDYKPDNNYFRELAHVNLKLQAFESCMIWSYHSIYYSYSSSDRTSYPKVIVMPNV